MINKKMPIEPTSTSIAANHLLAAGSFNLQNECLSEIGCCRFLKNYKETSNLKTTTILRTKNPGLVFIQINLFVLENFAQILPLFCLRVDKKQGLTKCDFCLM